MQRPPEECLALAYRSELSEQAAYLVATERFVQIDPAALGTDLEVRLDFGRPTRASGWHIGIPEARHPLVILGA